MNADYVTISTVQANPAPVSIKCTVLTIMNVVFNHTSFCTYYTMWLKLLYKPFTLKYEKRVYKLKQLYKGTNNITRE